MRTLIAALGEAMQHARDELGLDALLPTADVMETMAEHMTAAGWPASLDHSSTPPALDRGSQDEVGTGNC